MLQTLRIRRSVSGSWLGQPSPNLWGNASTGGRPTTAGAKSIYDPCPPGWRVPPPEAWTLEQTTVSSTIEGGCYLYTGSVWPYYPYAGLLHVMPTGKEMYVGVGIRTQLWTNVPGSPASDPSRVDATTAVNFRRPAARGLAGSTVRIIRPQPIL